MNPAPVAGFFFFRIPAPFPPPYAHASWKGGEGFLICLRSDPPMCGRFTQNLPWPEIHRLADLTGQPRNLAPRFNIAPTTPIEVIRPADAGDELVPMYWGSSRRVNKAGAGDDDPGLVEPIEHA
jgi:hypothetical protein